MGVHQYYLNSIKRGFKVDQTHRPMKSSIEIER